MPTNQDSESGAPTKRTAEDSFQRTALVTGSAMGIGLSIARRLASDGYSVIIADINAVAAESAVADLKSAGLNAVFTPMDVGRPEAIAEAFRAIERDHGRCDVLVNNAGIAKTFPFLDFPYDNWVATMNINVTGALLCSQHAARLMTRQGWGRIVNIASVAGERAVGHGRTAYGVSKAAIIGLTRQMAAELAELGVTSNAVAPGPVSTPMTEVLHSAEFRATYTAAIPAKRYGAPEEIAAAVSFLASEGAGYVNGVVLPVDGGFLAAGALPRQE